MGRIITLRGNMFDDPTALLVIPVNCVGVMGAGVALEYRQRFPDEFSIYVELCRTKRLQLLKPQLVHREGSQPALFFPTKRHWREDSELSVVRSNLGWMARQLEDGVLAEYKRIALPAVGAGLGNLSYQEVREAIYIKLNRTPATIYHYLPF